MASFFKLLLVSYDLQVMAVFNTYSSNNEKIGLKCNGHKNDSLLFCQEKLYFVLKCNLLFLRNDPSIWMPTLGMMEQLSRQLCGKMRRSGKRTPIPSTPASSSPKGLEVHFYLADTNQLEYFRDCHTTEDICVESAKRCCELTAG